MKGPRNRSSRRFGSWSTYKPGDRFQVRGNSEEDVFHVKKQTLAASGAELGNPATLQLRVARFLLEFDAECSGYKSLEIPVIPSSASSGAIHKLLTTHVYI